jgi:hypothetical protein
VNTLEIATHVAHKTLVNVTAIRGVKVLPKSALMGRVHPRPTWCEAGDSPVDMIQRRLVLCPQIVLQRWFTAFKTGSRL